MKVFISYRRTDTGGRAGRLFDLVAERFGARNVFQDVTAIEPGADFAQRVEDAIAGSDAVLVVIGRDWLSARDAEGTRRLDLADDFVRREIASALAAGIRVVPVLVDGASLPAAADLPADLAPLATRQAVTLDDATWHQDADAILRRLEGDEIVGALSRRWVFVAMSIVAVAGVAVAGWLWLRDSDDGDGSDDDASDELTMCPDLDFASWTSIPVDANAVVTERLVGTEFEVAVKEAGFRIDDDEVRTTARVELRNMSAPDAGESAKVTHDVFRALLIDGLVQEPAWCFTARGDANVLAGERLDTLIGYSETDDPTGLPVELELSTGKKILFAASP